MAKCYKCKGKIYLDEITIYKDKIYCPACAESEREDDNYDPANDSTHYDDI